MVLVLGEEELLPTAFLIWNPFSVQSLWDRCASCRTVGKMEGTFAGMVEDLGL